MKGWLLPISLLLVCGEMDSSPEQDFKAGNAFAAELLNHGNTVKIEEILGVPDAHPPEAGYSDAELGYKAQGLIKEGTASGMIVESSRSRERYKIDPEADPVIQTSNEIISSPLTVIGGQNTKIVKVKISRESREITCEESGDPSQEACKGHLNIRLVDQKKERKRTGSGKINISGEGTYSRDAYYSKNFRDIDFAGPCRALKEKFRARGSTRFSITVAEDVTEELRACAQNREAGISFPFSVEPSKLKKATLLSASAHNTGWVRENQSYWMRRGFLLEADFVIEVIDEVTEKVFDTEEWLWACDDLEGRSDQGLCTYETEDCTSGQQTRVLGGISLTRPCWEKARIYLCSYPARNDCGPLRAHGCYQTKSTCQKWVGKTCVVHAQTYQCDAGKNTGMTEAIQGEETPFCLDGNCTSQGWDSNDEMGSAMEQLSILKQLQEDFRKDKVSLFKGDDNRCKKEALGFKDCCKDNGWGQSMNLASCSGDERLLAEKKSKKLCHFVGTYCDKKILGKCISKKSTYCCFGTKLSRIFHEQGRAQISLGWGDAQSPVCRGFGIEEIQKIDFSRIDLHEVFEEVVRNYSAPDLSIMKKQIEGRMQDIQKSIKSDMNLKNLPPQRKEG